MSNFYGATSKTGGGSGALDAIDGANLADGDGAVVIQDGSFTMYHLDATKDEAENSPLIISPDSNAGTKRWVLANYNTEVNRHIRIGATSMFKKDSLPEEDLVGICPVLKFDPDADEQAYYNELVPFRLKAGTTITAIVDWCYEGTSDAGKVKWGLEFINIATGEAVAGSTTTITGISAGSHTSGQKVSTTLETGITGSVAEDDLAIRIYRDADDGANDTLLVDACFMKLHLHFIMNKLGESL